METIDEIRQELENQRRRTEVAEARALAEQRQREEAEARATELENKQSSSSFLDYVRWTEQVLFQTFHVKPALMPQSQSHSQSETTGTASAWKSYTATRVNGKFYPRCLRPWDFQTTHSSLFTTLVTAFGEERAFPALTDILGVSRDLSPGPVDEQDLRPFIRAAIEKPAARVVTEYIQRMKKDNENNDNDRDFVKITFQNNPYGLDLAQETALEVAQEATQNTPSPEPPVAVPPPAKRRRSPVKTIGVPDRWCVGLGHDGGATHILVGEYKAAHKLPAQKLNTVFSKPPDEDFFIQAVNGKGVNPEAALGPALDTPPTTKARAAPITSDERQLTPEDVYIACVLCQAYHYMITAGLEFGYVASGDGLVFLRVLEDDPQTLYYFWSIFPVPAPVLGQAPEADVTEAESTSIAIREPNQTALSYLASLCMLAIKSPVRPMSWIDARDLDLSRWPNPYNKALPLTMTTALLPTPQNPHRDDEDGNGNSTGPGQRARGGTGRGGNSGENSHSSVKRPHSSYTSGGSGGDGTGSGTTRRKHWAVQLPTLPYCTQGCLHSLRTGAPLDGLCPNVALHRAARPPQAQGDGHPLTATELCAGIVAQLAQNMDKDCQCLDKWGFFGRCGVLFKLTLSGYGYTFVAKGVQAPHRPILEGEAAVYTALAAYQGRLIPVFLGISDLERPMPLQSLARIPHLMLLSYAGPPLPANKDCVTEAARTTAELEAAGLCNDDIHLGNMTWNEEVGRMMLFDFDQARIRTVPQPQPQPQMLHSLKRGSIAYRRDEGEGGTPPNSKRIRIISA
ncbi:hypothetical protein SPBR_08195 [Sporothrix brasiliensis 5110]|uniref:Metalloprotease m41 n=1 Tax=Sporothrix brasiliensis 5110 TaxID=1398154 RepID=A0A0C2EK15_9PEZI|nr:uncharacterized protein SPBR_08195 [Sporothrix brasiliensis 5110]KIH86429.1 hypothetical protein SPBR_08195 [Sporothrix brasiliensis 5110]